MTGSDAVSVDGHADVPSETSVLTAAMETDASTVRCLFLVYRQDQLEVLWLSPPPLTYLDDSVPLPDASILFCDAVRVDLRDEDARCLL